jgi:teichuronic acid biosynthesis glycosyltransferase TuaG
MRYNVSVILPLYNAEVYLESSIISVLSQTYTDFELLIIDDCSTDESLSIAKKYEFLDDRVKVYSLAENSGGPAKPRNFGVKTSVGYFVAFIDSDDIWHPQKLAIQIDFYKRTGSYLISTSMKLINKKTSYDDYLIYIKDESYLNLLTSKSIEKITYSCLLMDNKLPNSSVMVRSDIIKNYSFNESPEFVAVEDFIMWLCLHKEIGPSLKLDIPLLAYRVLDNSISNNKLNMVYKRNAVLNLFSINFIQRYFFMICYLLNASIKRFNIFLSLSKNK